MRACGACRREMRDVNGDCPTRFICRKRTNPKLSWCQHKRMQQCGKCFVDNVLPSLWRPMWRVVAGEAAVHLRKPLLS